MYPLGVLMANLNHFAMLAFLVLLFYNVIRYMVGRLLNNETLTLTAKQGLEQWVEALFFYVIINLIISVSNGIIYGEIQRLGWDGVLSERGLSCSPTDNCLILVAKAVVDNHIETAQSLLEEVRDVLGDAFYSHVGVSSNSIFMAYLDVSYSRELLNSFALSKAQKEADYIKMALLPLVMIEGYLSHYAYILGMLFLLLGIILKATPYLDKVGASMIALGITSLYVFPLLVVFFLSPSMVFGSISSSECPAVCQQTPFAVTGPGPTAKALTYREFLAMVDTDPLTSQEVEEFLAGDRATVDIDGETYYSCDYYGRPTPQEVEAYAGTSEVENFSCTSICRILPYPNLDQCRRAEPFCRDLYSQFPRCFKHLYTSAHLSKEVFYNGIPMPLGEAMAESECFTLQPLLPLHKTVKGEYPLPFPQACRYVIAKKEEGGWQFSPTEECSKFLQRLEDINATKANRVRDALGLLIAILNTTDPHNEHSFDKVLSRTKAFLRDPNKWEMEKAPEDAYSAFGIIVDGNCTLLNAPTTSLVVPRGYDCSICASIPGVGRGEDKLAFLLASAWGGSMLAVGSSLMFVVSLSMALSGFMFIPALRRLGG